MTRLNYRTAASLAGLSLLGLSGTAGAQQVFQQDNSGNPGGGANNQHTENIDFGDVDLDGDWDAVFADGGDFGNQQNRIWMNRGGAQGGPIGDFLDQTSTRFPQQADDSRDIEFADIDNDGDIDIYVSNTSQIVNQGNKWWVNNGGTQGGSLGFFADETNTRWVGLGGPNSSIASAGILPNGSFIDWSCDCDFGDLDNDGDLDLVHSTYGGGFNGGVPTRLFLNDGDGRFEELNPQGTTLGGISIAVGNTAIWAEGTYQPNTNNNTGQQADIATNTLDIDIGDMDGDFDLDILHGDRDSNPRIFYNRLEESGTLIFRDVTTAVLPNNYVVNGGNYEQEMGDMDGDGDLDIYGLNWAGNAGSDRTFRNNGSGNFTNLQTNLPGSFADDNEGDFMDYDNDGDLDLFVANFTGSDKLYDNPGNGVLTSVIGEGTNGGQPSLDVDAADIDGDGDYDVIVGEDNNAANKTFFNITNIPDTHAPYIPNVEDPGNQSASTTTVPVRAQVYDNAPYYITWYNPTQLNVSVDGCELPSIPALSSQGQIFRAELPGNLVGNVEFEWQSEDEYGNTGTSATTSYTGSTSLGFTSKFGLSSNSVITGVAPSLDVLSVPFGGTDLFLAARGANDVPYLMALFTDQIPGGLTIPGLAIANITGTQILFLSGNTGPDGCDVLRLPLNTTIASGFTFFGQTFTLDGATNGDLTASSQGTSITTQ